MTQQATGMLVNRSITVAAPVERAFGVFTDQFDAWWPRTHHIGDAEMDVAVLEPWRGGRWYEKGVDGSECDWGRVLIWEPPHRLMVSWQIDVNWKHEPDPTTASEIEVRFTPEGPSQTRVELEHRAFERHGDDGKTIHDAVGGEGGWGALLERYAAALHA
jgi:Activator of Hsp90 ATPase homolog 1-like protein